MSINPVSQIRDFITHAREHDKESAQLLSLLEKRAQYLHEAIKLPDDHAADLLADFVVRYIEQVPNFIEAITSIAQEAGIYDGVSPLLNIACDYFLSPPDIVNGHSHLETLLDEAYLAHRLLEEVNDRTAAVIVSAVFYQTGQSPVGFSSLFLDLSNLLFICLQSLANGLYQLF